MNPTGLNRLQLDALKEISSIGAGNAATALSQFLNKKVEMLPPEIVALTAEDPLTPIPQTVSSMALVALEAIGEVSGYIVVAFGLRNASFLIDSLMGKAWGSTTPESLSEIDISAFKEVGSVMSASFLRVTGEMIGITLRMSTPYFTTGARAKISEFIVEKAFRNNPGIFCLNSRLCIIDTGRIEGFLLFFPSANSLTNLLKLLGVE
jgi:chemotaxis protein CheC